MIKSIYWMFQLKKIFLLKSEKYILMVTVPVDKRYNSIIGTVTVINTKL